MASNTEYPAAWNILIVDDDDSVLSVTKLALRNFKVDGGPTRLHAAKSRAEAQAFLASKQNVAVMITDVVMESDQAGLELVSWVRTHRHFDAMRLVIRTGQAGLAPEETVLRELNINDYWPKTDISAHRMRTILTGLVRSFRDIRLINTQKERLEEMQAQIVETERYKALNSLASGIAHDVNNALTPITAYASMLVDIDDLTAEERKEYAEIILQASQDAGLVVRRLKGNYSADLFNTAENAISIQKLLMDSAALARPKLAAQEEALDIEISLTVDTDLSHEIPGNAGELRQAILNLIINAVDAMTSNGKIELLAEISSDTVDIVVTDTGSGMEKTTLNRCLRAFFTTKGNRGTGLGLPMVERTIKAHGGSMTIQSALGEGTTVRLHFPHNK